MSGFHVSGFDSESSLMYFTTSNHTLITGGEFGPEGGVSFRISGLHLNFYGPSLSSKIPPRSKIAHILRIEMIFIDKGTGATCVNPFLSLAFFLKVANRTMRKWWNGRHASSGACPSGVRVQIPFSASWKGGPARYGTGLEIRQVDFIHARVQILSFPSITEQDMSLRSSCLFLLFYSCF